MNQPVREMSYEQLYSKYMSTRISLDYYVAQLDELKSRLSSLIEVAETKAARFDPSSVLGEPFVEAEDLRDLLDYPR